MISFLAAKVTTSSLFIVKRITFFLPMITERPCVWQTGTREKAVYGGEKRRGGGEMVYHPHRRSMLSAVTYFLPRDKKLDVNLR